MLNAPRGGQLNERLAGTAIRGITQPLLVLSLGFGLPALGMAHFLEGVAQELDLALAALFPLLFGITHVYFMFHDPDRLQSEEFRLRDRSLSLVETGHGIIRDPELLALSTRPDTDFDAIKSSSEVASEIQDDAKSASSDRMNDLQK